MQCLRTREIILILFVVVAAFTFLPFFDEKIRLKIENEKKERKRNVTQIPTNLRMGVCVEVCERVVLIQLKVNIFFSFSILFSLPYAH